MSFTGFENSSKSRFRICIKHRLFTELELILAMNETPVCFFSGRAKSPNSEPFS